MTLDELMQEEGNNYGACKLFFKVDETAALLPVESVAFRTDAADEGVLVLLGFPLDGPD